MTELETHLEDKIGQNEELTKQAARWAGEIQRKQQVAIIFVNHIKYMKQNKT